MSELPRFIELAEAEGDDSSEQWKNYLECLYLVYLKTLVNAGLTFRGLRVRYRQQPDSDHKHFSFWHLVQEGYPETHRTPDLERCRRLLWVSWIIEQSSTHPGIRVFPQAPRYGEKPWALWLVEQGYVVILAFRSDYFLLKTAFLITTNQKKASLEREWQAYRNEKTEAAQ